MKNSRARNLPRAVMYTTDSSRHTMQFAVRSSSGFDALIHVAPRADFTVPQQASRTYRQLNEGL